MEEGQRLLMGACSSIGDKHPYFEPVVLKFRFERNDDISTCAISPNLVVTYNQDFIRSLSKDDLSSVTLHEALHFLSNHHSRCDNNPLKNEANHMLHNIAMDMEVNDRLRDMGYQVPNGVYPDNFTLPDGSKTDYPRGLVYEEYFKRLLKDIREQFASGKAQSKKGDGDSDSSISISMDGKSMSYDSEKPLDNVEGGSSAESEELVDSIKDECEAKGKEASSDSNPSVSTAVVEQKKYPWNIIFRNILAKAIGPIIHGYEFRSYCAFNKKNACQEIMLPTWREHKPEINIIIIMDVSGSMYDIILDMYSKMKSISTMISDTIHIKILETDTEVINVIDNFDTTNRKIRYSNGGGTDMTAGWKYIYDNKLKSDLIICMTDGYTPYPTKADPYFYKDKSVCIISEKTNDCPYKWYPSEF